MPPSQWTRIRPAVLGYSRDPAAETQAQAQRAAARQRWAEAAAAAPRVRALKQRLEADWLPSMERDVAEAEAALEAAQARLICRIVAAQGNEVMEIDRQPAVMVTQEDEREDPDVLAAQAKLRTLRAGLARLREQLAQCTEHLALVDYQRPPED